MVDKSRPSVARLREVFILTDEGALLRRRDSGFRWKAGQVAGHYRSDGYVSVRVDGFPLLAHHVVWALTHGEYPPSRMDIDHINRDRGDNRISNLRLADRSQNMYNTVAHKDSKSGVKGVAWHAQYGKWEAYITKNYKKTCIGFYDDIEDAAAARREAEEALA
jgi:hypothetical protein